MDEDLHHAFGSFYERHVDAVTAYVARRTRRPDVVFDLVAETFARALANRDSYDPQRGPAIGWLFGIARNLVIDAARRGKVAAEARERLGMDPVALDDDALERVVQRSSIDLDDALKALPEAQREAVLRRVVAEESYPEIAASVGTSEQVVRQRVARGLAAMRKVLV